MTELVKLTSLPARQGSILLVKDVVQLKEHADELDRIALEVNDVLRRFEKFEKGEHYRFTPSLPRSAWMKGAPSALARVVSSWSWSSAHSRMVRPLRPSCSAIQRWR